jgi:hypothetical protein
MMPPIAIKISESIYRLFLNNSPLSEDEYRIGRAMFLADGASASGIAALSGGAFIAGYATFLGADDRFIGIIIAIPALAGIAQLFSSFLFERLTRRKFSVSILAFIHRLMLGFLFLIPLLQMKNSGKLLLLTMISCIAWSIGCFFNPAVINWMS